MCKLWRICPLCTSFGCARLDLVSCNTFQFTVYTVSVYLYTSKVRGPMPRHAQTNAFHRHCHGSATATVGGGGWRWLWQWRWCMYACSLSLHMASARSHASSRADQRVSPPLPRVGHGHGGWRWRWNALVWGQSQWGLSWLAPYHQFLQVFFKLDSIVLAVMDAMGLIDNIRTRTS